MNLRQAFAKLEIEPAVAAFCKAVNNGSIPSPFSKSERCTIIRETAADKIKGRLSPAQKFSRFISSGTGLEMYRCLKVSSGREVEQAPPIPNSPISDFPIPPNTGRRRWK